MHNRRISRVNDGSLTDSESVPNMAHMLGCDGKQVNDTGPLWKTSRYPSATHYETAETLGLSAG